MDGRGHPEDQQCVCGESALTCMHARGDRGVFCNACLFAVRYITTAPSLLPTHQAAATRVKMMRGMR